MTRIVEEDIAKLGREPFEDEGGISVLACLSTSHIAIHTWPLRCEFHLDIYSCREFDKEAFIKTLKEHFPNSHVEATDFTKVESTFSF